MFIRQLSPERFQYLQIHLFKAMHRQPLDAAFYCDVQINEDHYRLRLYLMDRQRIVPTQAICTHRVTQQCELITDPTLLGALTEVALAQCPG